MKLPAKHTRRYLILELLQQSQPLTVHQMADEFGMALASLSATVGALRDLGYIEHREKVRRASPQYVLSADGRRLMNAGAQGEAVSAPIRNVFGPEIQARHIPSAFGTRPGSNDMRACSSKHF